MNAFIKNIGWIAALLNVFSFVLYFFIAKEFPDHYEKYSTYFTGIYFVVICFTTSIFTFILYRQNKKTIKIGSVYLLCSLFFIFCFLTSFIDWIFNDGIDVSFIYYCLIASTLITLINILIKCKQ